MRRSLATFAAFVILCVALVGLAMARVPLPGSVHRVDTAAALQPAPTARSADAPVFVELFTSQGCSSCPPADAVLQRLADDPTVVAVSRNVTYWDRLGWRDTLGRAGNTALQQRYAARGVDNGEIYTPQAVINGRSGVVGSREAELTRAIDAGARARRTGVRVTADSASTLAPAAGQELRFIAVASRRAVDIGRGENGGRQVAYHNVVLNEAMIACPAEAACSATIPANLRSQPGADRFAVVLQGGNGGPVLAARWLPLAR